MPWLAPNVFKQDVDQPLSTVPKFDEPPKLIKFRHIIHVYDDKDTPTNTAVQAISFDTVADAIALASASFQAACVAVTYPDDKHLVPPGVTLSEPLSRCAYDVIDVCERRPLPLLYDILDLGLSAFINWNGDDFEEFIVMTNSDIHIQPTFYRLAAEIIGMGYDVATINRRTIDVAPENRANRAMYAADAGSVHPGFDCFIFPARLYQSFLKVNSCCGAGLVMRSLIFNLVSTARRFLMVTGAHATYHLGDDRKWQVPGFAEYEDSNAIEAKKVLYHFGRSLPSQKNLIAFVNSHESEMFNSYLNSIDGIDF
jgi:hypothetical protein